jgi:protein-S-isoprenylcysteine O-methyltransferase Ste14
VINTEDDSGEQLRSPSATPGIRSPIIGSLCYVLFMALLLFVSAGSIDWLMAWIFLAVSLAIFLAGIVGTDPALTAERSRRHDDSRRWDRILVPAIVLLGLLGLIVAGLTYRFVPGGQIPLPFQGVALIGMLLGNGLVFWATRSNSFFSVTFRIQNDRGHTVAAAGPYRYVRHPGYIGMIAVALFQPLLLGSFWALLPAIVSVVLFVVRTGLEDRALCAELGGYRNYASRVRYRLIPGVW